MSKVEHPQHYNGGNIECIDAMESAFGTEATIDFCKINAFKYIWRAGEKYDESELDDLSKAQWYISKALEMIKKNEYGAKDV